MGAPEGSVGSALAFEMGQARRQLQEHTRACRYCREFAALCPVAVRLFIQWRGKSPDEHWILGGAAWLDGEMPAEQARLLDELNPGPAWQEVHAVPPKPRPLIAEGGWQLLEAYPHQWGPGKVHFAVGERNADGATPLLCSHDALGWRKVGRAQDVTCKHCLRAVKSLRGEPLKGDQLSLFDA